MRRAVKFNQIL